MSETLGRKPELHQTPHSSSERYEHEHHHETTSNVRHEHQENLDEIMSKVEETARTSSQELARYREDEAKHAPPERQFVGDELKGNTLKRSLRQIRKNLKPYQRPFSKFLHNTAVEGISEASAKTIARPEGLLFGGIASFLASIAVLLACYYYGYEYNYFIGLISFPTGFVLGLIIEFLIRPLWHRNEP